ncbi:MAG: DnaD domain protein [Chloroflexi bacterium]|nr:DnaD domain protein [Chloroflexota bacterium]
MSALVMGLVWELQESPDFGRAEKFVLMAYADHADSNGKNIYPSINLVMKKTFYEERNVQKITRALENLGYLVADGMGPHGTNRWAIPISRSSDGGAKIAPVQNAGAENAPEGNAPEGNAPEPSVVEVIKPDDRFGEVAKKLSGLTGGALNSLTADLINEWLLKHTNEWIIKAIEIAIAKGAKAEKYVDRILIGWEANGYPKSRAEQVQGAKNGNTRSTSSAGNGSEKSGSASRQAGKANNQSGNADAASGEPAVDEEAAARHRERWERLRRKAKVPAVQ